MLRCARRSLPPRDKVHASHVIDYDPSKSAVVDPFDAPAHVCDRKPSASDPLELGRRTNARRLRFRFQHRPRHIVSLSFSSYVFN